MRDLGDLSTIVQDGILAPSGDNCQPWRFEIERDAIHLFHVPEEESYKKSTVPYYYLAGCVAHGAAIKNMMISAAARGLATEVTLFPRRIDPLYIATLKFKRSNGPLPESELAPFLKERHSNRQAYRPTVLDAHEKAVLETAAHNSGDIAFKILDDRAHINRLANNLTEALIFILKQKKLRQFLYAHLSDSRDHSGIERGINHKALDLLPIQSFLFNLLRSPIIFALAYYSGILRLALMSESRRFSKTAAYGLLYSRTATHHEHIHTGLTLEQIWLAATQHKIAVHPATATIYLYQNLLANKYLFSESEARTIHKLHTDLQLLFGIGQQIPLFLMRLGHAAPMRERSLRRPAHSTAKQRHEWERDPFIKVQENIIADGILAPSAENTQPWSFTIRNRSIDIVDTNAQPPHLQALYAAPNYMTHGALIENMVLSAQHHECRSHVQLFPEPNNLELTARITLTPAYSEKKDPLYHYIDKRHTNRNYYSNTPIPDSEVRALLDTDEEYRNENINLHITNSVDSITRLASSFIVSDEILLANPDMHDFFYEHFYWHPEEHKDGRGIFAPTLEIQGMQILGLKLMKQWMFLKLFERTGLLRKAVTKSNARYQHSGAMAIITVTDTSPATMITAGRLMQRMWLRATSVGLSLHPCTALLHFYHGIQHGSTLFSAEHSKRIFEAYKNIADTFGVTDDDILFFARIGRAQPPSAVTTRTRPHIEYW